MVYIYTATIHEEDGTFYAAVPDIPGCITTGHSLSDAIDQITDALSACLCTMEDNDDPIPAPSEQCDISHEAAEFCTLVRVDTIAYRSLTDTRAVRHKSGGIRRCGVVIIRSSFRRVESNIKLSDIGILSLLHLFIRVEFFFRYSPCISLRTVI